MKKILAIALFLAAAPLQAMSKNTLSMGSDKWETERLRTLIQKISYCLSTFSLPPYFHYEFASHDRDILYVIINGTHGQNHELVNHAARYAAVKARATNNIKALACVIQKTADTKSLHHNKRYWGSYRVAMLLLHAQAQGIDTQALLALKNSKGQTPLEIACRSGIDWSSDYQTMVKLLSDPFTASNLTEAREDFLQLTHQQKDSTNIFTYLQNRELGIK